MEAELNEKLGQLIFNLGSLSSMAVAFSGGVDSSLLLKVAQGVLDKNVLAVIVDSPTLPRRELQDALDFIAETKTPYRVIAADNLQIPGFTDNPVDRCYLCKKELFTQIKETAFENGIKWVAEGSNMDDLSDDRPGMRAINELGILSPLLEAELTKEEIRQLARRMQLKVWDKPAAACLASRFAHGQQISPEKLNMVEQGEDYLLALGFRQVRVRSHEAVARIEVAAEERNKFFNEQIMDDVHAHLKAIGFRHVCLDLAGYRTGGSD